MWMQKKDHEIFDRELLADDSGTPQSHGTGILLGLMGVRPPGPTVEMTRPVQPGGEE